MKRLKYVRSATYPLKAWLIALLAVFCAEMLIMLGLPLVLPPRSPLVVYTAIDAVILTLTIAPIVWWLIVRPLNALLELRSQHLKDLFASIEAERRRVAADLHDGVGQSLTILISGLRSGVNIADLDETHRRCRELQRVCQEALSEVKRITSGLRPSLLDDLGLASAVSRLAADTAHYHGVEISVDVTKLPPTRLPASVETATYRIIQEALTNLAKHSGARSGSVTVSIQQGAVVACVEDDGVGLERAGARGSNGPSHLGLTGMSERASLLGGKVTIDSNPKLGTRVVVKIPVDGTGDSRV